jgi:hypothetical protein
MVRDQAILELRSAAEASVLIESLGTSLPSRVMRAYLRMACTRLTAVDPSLQHADSTTVGVLLACRTGGLEAGIPSRRLARYTFGADVMGYPRH